MISTTSTTPADWQQEMSRAVRDPAELIDRLDLPADLVEPARRAAKLFPLRVPESYLRRMQPGDPSDPLLRQVLPLDSEFDETPEYQTDPLQEADSHLADGLLQKYPGRALMIATGHCAVHCRYCFRRHYPYNEEPKETSAWDPAIAAIAADHSLREILLSGGDPLMLADRKLKTLTDRLEQIPHLSRLRIHTRLPIVLPSRVTDAFIGWLRGLRLTSIIVVHANHPQEIQDDCADALRHLVRSGIPVLNQSVLLRSINDDVETLTELSERLTNLGVIPYYLHQTDRVSGTAHFAVSEATGRELIAEMRRRLPGYAVPTFVQEVPGEMHKTPLAL